MPFSKILHTLKTLFLGIKKEYFLLLIPISILDILFLTIAQSRNEFYLTNIATLLFFSEKIVFDFFFTLLLVLLCKKIFKTTYIAFLFFLFVILTSLTDSLLYFFGNTLFEIEHINLIDYNAIKGFVGLQFSLIILLGLATSISSYAIIKKVLKNSISMQNLMAPLIYMIIILSIALPSKIYTWTDSYHSDDYWSVHHDVKAQLHYISQNGVINFFKEVLYSSNDSQYKQISSTDDFKKTVQKFNISLGKKQAQEKIEGKPFKRIILVVIESLSLDLLSGYNNKMPVKTSDFYSSDKMKSLMFTKYMTSHSPTLQGLTVMFNSLPNYKMTLNGYAQNALPNLLKKADYHTVFFRSASKYFANENIHFKNLGFDEIVAKQEFMNSKKYEKYKKYVSEWGVPDEILYKAAVDYIKEHRDEKLFITLFNTDTHPPHGRKNFKHIKKPPLPESYKKFARAHRFMKNIWYNDQRVKELFYNLEKNNLLDDDTLLIITADHAAQYNNIIKSLVKRRFLDYPSHSLARIPLLFYTKRKLPHINKSQQACQLDFAPTLLHLLHITPPSSYWGDSLFSKTKKPFFVGENKHTLYLKTDKDKLVTVPLRSKKTKYQEIISLYNAFISAD